MDFLFLNKEELGALMGLPHIQQVTYLLGIRPYMDRQTSIVGIKRRISYQSLSEALYVEPHQGIQSGSPSRQQLRRIVKSLERSGLIEIQSDDMHLILKCKLAGQHFSVQNKADTNPTPQADTKCYTKNTVFSESFSVQNKKAETVKIAKADTPHKVSNNYLYVCFEAFWNLYPEKRSKEKAWRVFEKLNPDDALFRQLMEALEKQIQCHKASNELMQWTPKWKYPENWLLSRSWEDEVKIESKGESGYVKQQRFITQSSEDLFWCESLDESSNNVIEFKRKEWH